MLDDHDFNLVKLVQTVETAHILAVGAGLTTETGGVGAILHREVALLEDNVAVDVGHRHLGGGVLCPIILRYVKTWRVNTSTTYKSILFGLRRKSKSPTTRKPLSS